MVMSQKSKKKISREMRLAGLTENNRASFIEFEQWITNPQINYTPGTIDQISSVILKFLYGCGKTDANELTIESFSLFFDAEQRVATRNTKVHHIINFFTFLTEVKKSALTFGVSDLSSFLISTKVLKKDSEAGAAKPLNIEDIILIRNFLKNDYRKLFLFEMVYQYGFEFDDLVQCTEDNYDCDLGVFTIVRNRKKEQIYANERIRHIISKNRSVLNQVSKGTYQDRFGELGKKLQEIGLLNRTVRWMDIEKTRQRNFFQCPGGCEELYENTPDNWAIIQYTTDENHIKWIVCRKCALKGLKHE